MGTTSTAKASRASQRAAFARIESMEAQRVQDGMQYMNRQRQLVPGHGYQKTGYSFEDATTANNVFRNRYSNVFPWDATRVKLPAVEPHSNYINASYIKLSDKKQYIAAQGPLKTTIHHFWSMCYHESEKQGNDVIVVGMVTPLSESGITKCEKYWPSKEDDTLDFTNLIEKDGLNIDEDSKFKLQFIREKYNAKGDFIETELELKSSTKTKKVYHYYYFKWADTKTPPSVEPLLELSRELQMHSEYSKENPPVPVIHCSAGVGRTGTFIVLDYLLSRAKDTKKDDLVEDIIEDTVEKCRSQRMMMVQTIHQYQYLYQAAEVLKLCQ
ncbi:tyrosine-protein phosphatase 1 [[Candida] anglica]|uniref:Tyrosine-protein phosphatase 1 n=1 Tax=[Candida] anglica TaxID=148631 RepID=A0ABP0EGN1_9ASCO